MFKVETMTRKEAITRYRKARDTYEWAAKKACTGSPFRIAVEDNMPMEWLQTEIGSDIVVERNPTPSEWVAAAEYTVREFCDRYTVRNALWPNGDWEREQMEIAAGRIR